MTQVILVDMERIDLNPAQPRKKFSQEELESLADSIRTVGILHPPLVRMQSGQGRYLLIAGERRLRAARLAGLPKIPVLVEQQARPVEAALIENIQRVDLDPMEMSDALQRLIDEQGLRQQELADRIGKRRSTVANYLRLQQLPELIRASLRKGEITMGHAKQLLSLEGEEQMRRFEQLLAKPVSVHQMARKSERRIVRHRDGSGKLELPFASEEELQSILGRLG